MKKQLKKIIPACVLSLSLIGTSVSAAPPEHANDKKKYIPVQLLGVNDFHGQLDVYRTVGGKTVGGAEYLAAYLKQYEKQGKKIEPIRCSFMPAIWLEQVHLFLRCCKMNRRLNF